MSSTDSVNPTDASVKRERKVKYWHDPMMNPPYISDRPGQSPMGMDLVPVYEEEARALGFLSFVKENQIGGLFVDNSAQDRGVGYALMEQAKRLFSFLELDVYARNEKAVHFYLRQGFQAVVVFKGEDTGEESIRMRWIQ